jgi:signal transduction histidine kinase
MPTRQNLELDQIRPARLFASILIVVFVLEILIMLVMPRFLSLTEYPVLTACIDSFTLTTVLAILLWNLVVKPLQKLAQTRQKLLAQILQIQEQERRRIALDLHDGLGQSLTSLMVGLRTLQDSTTDNNIQSQAQYLREIGSKTHTEIRAISRGLRPGILDDFGLIPALEKLFEETRNTQPIAIQFQHQYTEENPRYQEAIETAIYRIVQEALANAIRHGHAQHIQVILQDQDQLLTVTIFDDGQGFDTTRLKSTNNSTLGLLSIHERACLLHGRVQITSRPAAGTTVLVQIPIDTTTKHEQDQHSPS